MKKLFLTVALVGGMLSFAAMNNGEPTKPAKQTKKVVVAEAELPTEPCIGLAFWFSDNIGYLDYESFNSFVKACEAA